MTIASILNPAPTEPKRKNSPVPAAVDREGRRSHRSHGKEVPGTPYKKIKTSKSSATVAVGAGLPVRIKFSPYETFDESIRRKQHEFRLNPACEDIKYTARRIPYSSEKSPFLEKTGRDFFEGRFY